MKGNGRRWTMEGGKRELGGSGQAVQLGSTPCSCLFVPSAAAVNRRRRALIGHRPALRHERKQGELIQARGGGMGRAPRGRQEP